MKKINTKKDFKKLFSRETLDYSSCILQVKIRLANEFIEEASLKELKSCFNGFVEFYLKEKILK